MMQGGAGGRRDLLEGRSSPGWSTMRIFDRYTSRMTPEGKNRASTVNRTIRSASAFQRSATSPSVQGPLNPISHAPGARCHSQAPKEPRQVTLQVIPSISARSGSAMPEKFSTQNGPTTSIRTRSRNSDAIAEPVVRKGTPLHLERMAFTSSCSRPPSITANQPSSASTKPRNTCTRSRTSAKSAAITTRSVASPASPAFRTW